MSIYSVDGQVSQPKIKRRQKFQQLPNRKKRDARGSFGRAMSVATGGQGKAMGDFPVVIIT